jgi:hypothetical protein
VSDAAYIEFDDTTFYFEAVTSEGGEHTATATEHNVEKGANVSDHVRPGLDKVSLEIFVSNHLIQDLNGIYGGGIQSVELDVPEAKKQLYPTPGSLISAATSALGDLISGKPAYKAMIIKRDKANVVKDIVTMLDGWRVGGVVGKVILPWKTYDSVVITKVAPSRKPENGDGATVSLDFQEIRLVESLLVTAPKPTEPRGKTAVAKGRQPTSFVREPAPAKKSLLSKLIGG